MPVEVSEIPILEAVRIAEDSGCSYCINNTFLSAARLKSHVWISRGFNYFENFTEHVFLTKEDAMQNADLENHTGIYKDEYLSAIRRL